MKILSLFDWMSVAQQSLEEIGIIPEIYYASEIDEYAIATTKSNFPNTKHVWSVVWLHINDDIDLMIWWSPCQDLSIAKKNRQWLEWSKSSLFWEYVRIRDEIKPKYFILENVASMHNEAKNTISEALGVEPIMINASLVSAQNRKRLFWVGKWNWEKYKQVEIQQPEDMGIILKDILENNVDEKYNINISEKYGIKWLCEVDWKSKAMTATMFKGYGNDGVTTVRVWSLNSWWQWDRIYSTKWKSVDLSANWWWRWAKTWLYNDCENIRKLTTTECLRLQSMPDDYFDKAEYKGKPISNTQRYKMCWNAFNCEVIKHILKQIF